MRSGEIVSGLMMATGVALLVMALAREAPARVASVKAKVLFALEGVRTALVDALLMAAGLALLLVQRLDPQALSRVLAGVKAAMWSAAVGHRIKR
jgi:hypothetical protein